MKKNKNKNRNRIIKLIIIIIIIILLLTRCSRDNLVIKNAKNYINKNDVQIKDSYNLKLSEMISDGYNFNLDDKCINNSYVEVTKVNGKLKYKLNLICSTKELTIDLIGNKNIELEFGSEYFETGAIAYYNNEDISSKIKIDSSNLNLSKLGTYKIVYKIDIDGIQKEIERTVKIIDSIKPTISLKGNLDLTIFLGSEYKDEGYIAFDNYDKDITDKVTVSGNVDTKKIGTYIITYEVMDSSLNKIKIQRLVTVKDQTYSTLNLKGLSTIYLDYPSSYTESGYSAFNSVDGDITNKVVVSGSVDTKKIGTYKITYSVKGSNGKTTSTTRTVIVRDTTKPTINLNSSSYLSIEYKEPYIEYNATAYDNYDKDITNRIVKTGFVDTNTLGKQYITYSVTDTSGNTTTLQRTVEIKDTTKPIIKINDNKENVTIEKGELYDILDGLEATDNYDGNITNKINYVANYNSNIIGTYIITYSVSDSNGNIADTITKTIRVVDTINPTTEISYSTTNITNQAVTVNIIANEEILINDPSWSCYLNMCSKTYNTNTTENIVVTDLSGNESIVAVNIENIDTVKPVGSVINNPSSLTNTDVTVTLTTNKDIKTPNGWTKVDNRTYTKTYAENITETITIIDNIGNSNTVDIVVDNINREIPTGVLNYSIDPTNQDIIVTLTIDKEVLPIEGWNTTDNLVFTKTYSSNTSETISFTDLYGNEGSINLDITNIDKTKPVLNISYSPDITHLTKEDVIVTIVSNKPVSSNTTGFTCIENICTKTYSSNTSETLTVEDMYGNTENISINVTNIDKEELNSTISYSTLNITQGPIIVTLIPNKLINDPIGWTKISDKHYEKSYPNNVSNEELIITDFVGNQENLYINITNIDNLELNGEASYSTQTLTNGDVEVTIVANKEIIPLIGWTRVDEKTYKKVYNSNYSGCVLIEDFVGRTKSIDITINNIDKVTPTGNVSYSKTTFTNTDVVVSITFDKPVNDIIGWETVDNIVFTKVYSENMQENIEYIDSYGNTGSINVNVDNIDKTPVTNTITYSSSTSTNGDVEVIITGNKNISISGFDCIDNICKKMYSDNITETVTLVDNYGNTKTQSISISCIDKIAPIITLNGANPYIQESKSTYNDPGASATDDIDGTIIVSKTGIVNTDIKGTYTITYSATDSAGNITTLTRTINVVDTIAPTISVDTNNVSIMVGSNYDLKTGVTAFDTYDGDITNNITVTSSPTFNNNSIGTYTIYYNVTDESGNQAVQKIRTVSVEECIDNGVTASAPVIPDNMIPIKYDGTKWIKADKDNTDNDWYDYKTQTWANAVTVTPETRDNYLSTPIGTPVLESDILTYLVWVPRYSYAIKSESLGITNGQSQICINFESKLTPKSTGTGSNTSFYTHPAFTFGNTELDGIWVGKFEMTGSISRLTTKPNLASVRSQTVNSMFNNTLAMKNENNIYGYPTSGVDTHMMKNSEWGAVTYLSQSKYGKYGNDNFTGTNKEIYINPSQGYITGRSGNVPNQTTLTDTSGGSSSNLYGYDGANCVTKTGFVCTGPKHETNGMAASTTGNIYGIYDMSGGSYDCVMANLNNTVSNSDFAASWFTTPGNEKYYDKYTKASALLSYESGLKGDAVYETEGWYGNYIGYLNSTRPWFNRGGLYSSASSAGIFASYNGDGISSASNSWRFVLTE